MVAKTTTAEKAKSAAEVQRGKVGNHQVNRQVQGHRRLLCVSVLVIWLFCGELCLKGTALCLPKEVLLRFK